MVIQKCKSARAIMLSIDVAIATKRCLADLQLSTCGTYCTLFNKYLFCLNYILLIKATPIDLDTSNLKYLPRMPRETWRCNLEQIRPLLSEIVIKFFIFPHFAFQPPPFWVPTSPGYHGTRYHGTRCHGNCPRASTN